MGEVAQMSTRARFIQILSILKKHKIRKGMDPVKFRLILEDLGPTFVKIGQIMSTRQDMFSERYCKELMKLRSHVTPMPFEMIQHEIETTYGKPLYDCFSSMDEIPLGAASIAQVHKATLMDGRKVVVKVQRPKIYDWMARDVSLLKKAIRVLNLSDIVSRVIDLNMVIDEFWVTAQQEMDFTNEACFAKRFKADYADCPFIDAPEIIDVYTKKNILVMEYVEGLDVTDHQSLIDAGYSCTDIADKLAFNYISQIIDHGFFHADPHSGNLRIRNDQIVWIDFGMMGILDVQDREVMKMAVRAIASKDTHKLVDAILLLGACKNEIDYIAFSNEMDIFIQRYLSLPYSQIDAARLIQDMFSICHKFKISLPKGISMLARSMMTIEGTLTALDPAMNTMKIALNHKAALKKVDYKETLKRGASKSISFVDSAMDLPIQASDVLRLFQKGQVKVNLNLMGSQAPLAKIDQMVNRIIVCVLIAALLVGSSLICTTNMKPQIFGIPAIGFFGFMIALCMSVWLFLKMLRLHQRNKFYQER